MSVEAGPAIGTGVRLQRVRVALGGATVVDAVDLTIGAGEWMGMIGPNGAGKTTLMRAIVGLQAHHGSIALGGRELHTLGPRERARLVALVPQDPVIPPGMTVFDYVLLGRTPHLGRRLALSENDRRVAVAVLQRLDLERFGSRPLTQLSGGERQRAVIGRALAQDAAVLLLDEPTSSLDLGHQQEVLELVDDLRTERGLTVVMTMHDLNLISQYADRLALLAEGRVVLAGAPGEVLDPDRLQEHYGADVQLVEGPDGPIIVPVRRR